MSSIVPCEESATQLCIANSVEVRSDEICADSVLSIDVAVPKSDLVKTDKNAQPCAVVNNQPDSITVTGIHSRLRSKTHTDSSTNQKSASCVAFHSNHKSQKLSTSRRSASEAIEGGKHRVPVLKTVCHTDAVDNNSFASPAIQNDVLKLSSQVWMHKDIILCEYFFVLCNTLHFVVMCICTCFICSIKFILSTATNVHGHRSKWYKNYSSSNIQKNFFAECVVSVWNLLPPTEFYITGCFQALPENSCVMLYCCACIVTCEQIR